MTSLRPRDAGESRDRCTHSSAWRASTAPVQRARAGRHISSKSGDPSDTIRRRCQVRVLRMTGGGAGVPGMLTVPPQRQAGDHVVLQSPRRTLHRTPLLVLVRRRSPLPNPHHPPSAAARRDYRLRHGEGAPWARSAGVQRTPRQGGPAGRRHRARERGRARREARHDAGAVPDSRRGWHNRSVPRSRCEVSHA
jgi:hypothetical protein